MATDRPLAEQAFIEKVARVKKAVMNHVKKAGTTALNQAGMPVASTNKQPPPNSLPANAANTPIPMPKQKSKGAMTTMGLGTSLKNDKNF